MTCNGSNTEVIKSWSGSSPVYSDVATSNNVTSETDRDGQLGDSKARFILADANVASDSASDFCANLNYSSFTDWYLPSKSELALLYCRSSNVKGTLYPQEMPGCTNYATYGYGYGTGWAGTGYYGPLGLPFNSVTGPTLYLSSTEADAGQVWAQDFTTGRQVKVPKNTPAAVRCIRKPFGFKF